MSKNNSINRRKFLSYFGYCSCGLLFPGCTTAPITERKQLKLLPESSLNRQAAKIYENVKRKVELSDDKIQLDKIKSGINKFERESIKIKTFFAPNHTFDKNTIKACKFNGINSIIDGYGIAPYHEDDVLFFPQLFYRLYALPFGFQTLQIHLNYFDESDFLKFEKFIENNHKKIISFSEACNIYNNTFLNKSTKFFFKKILKFKRLFFN